MLLLLSVNFKDSPSFCVEKKISGHCLLVFNTSLHNYYLKEKKCIHTFQFTFILMWIIVIPVWVTLKEILKLYLL